MFKHIELQQDCDPVAGFKKKRKKKKTPKQTKHKKKCISVQDCQRKSSTERLSLLKFS